MTVERRPIVRIDADGTAIDGTAAFEWTAGGFEFRDFRDLDGVKMLLPPGSCFEVPLQIVPLP